MKICKVPVEVFGANCWLAIDEATHETVVIDPSADADKIVKACSDRNAHIYAILLTHGHFDHIISLDSLRDMTGATVRIHRADAECLSDSDKNEGKNFFRYDVKYKPADILLSGGDIITFGASALEVMHTPGHTRGSVCYVGDSCIFTGDTLFDQSIGRCDMNGGSETDMERSLKKLAALEKNYTLYPGHGAVTTLDKQREFNPYFVGL